MTSHLSTPPSSYKNVLLMDHTTRDDECDDSLEATTLPSKAPEETQDYVLNVDLLPKELKPVADIFDNQYQSTKMIQVLKIVHDVKTRGEKTIIFVGRDLLIYAHPLMCPM